jgi:hypothetical protein
MLKFGHTPYIENQIVGLATTPPTNNTMLKANYKCKDPKMAQLFMSMPHKTFTFLWVKHHPHLSICPYPKKSVTFPLEQFSPMTNPITLLG